MLPACCLLLYRNFVEIFENDNRSDTAISFAGIMTVVNYDGFAHQLILRKAHHEELGFFNQGRCP
jgi:hypothetical protein